MRKSKRSFLNLFNVLWTFIMATLGFTACEHTTACEYGMPTAKYKIKGKVIDSREQPTADIQIIVKQLQGGRPTHAYSWDTLKTDIQGEFLYELNDVTEDEFRIDWQDKKLGLFKHDSIDIEMPKPTGGKGWYRGESYEEVTIILKDEIDTEDGQ